jgi:hypothetical protein
MVGSKIMLLFILPNNCKRCKWERVGLGWVWSGMGLDIKHESYCIFQFAHIMHQKCYHGLQLKGNGGREREERERERERATFLGHGCYKLYSCLI